MRVKKIKHLTDNNGSWTYRRRVPGKHQKTLGYKMWSEPCGDVPYAEAVVKVAKWTADHDALIDQLDDPETAKKVRLSTEAQSMSPKVDFLIAAHNAGELPGEFDPLEAAKAGIKVADGDSEIRKQNPYNRRRWRRSSPTYAACSHTHSKKN